MQRHYVIAVTAAVLLAAAVIYFWSTRKAQAEGCYVPRYSYADFVSPARATTRGHHRSPVDKRLCADFGAASAIAE